MRRLRGGAKPAAAESRGRVAAQAAAGPFGGRTRERGARGCSSSGGGGGGGGGRHGGARGPRSERRRARGPPAARAAGDAAGEGEGVGEEDEYEYVVEEVEVEIDEQGREIGPVGPGGGPATVIRPDAVAVNDAEVFREQSEARVRRTKEALAGDARRFKEDAGAAARAALRGHVDAGGLRALVPSSGLGRLAVALPAAVLLGSFASACVTVVRRHNSPWFVRKRGVTSNKLVVEELGALLPARRDELTGAKVAELRRRTGYSNPLIFRKYLRFWLDRRPLVQDSVYDILLLRDVCALGEPDVVETVKENVRRAFNRTGIIMSEGVESKMSTEGAKKKAAGRDNLGKLLYLIESSGLVSELDSVNVLRDELVSASGIDAADLGKFRVTLEEA